MIKGKKFPLVERPTPVIDFLVNRKTLILDEPILSKVDPPEIRVDTRTISREEAINVIARSSWAQGLAEGWLRAFVPEKAGTPEWEELKWRIARKVAAGVI